MFYRPHSVPADFEKWLSCFALLIRLVPNWTRSQAEARGGLVEVVHPQGGPQTQRPISVSSIWKKLKKGEPKVQITLSDWS